MSEWTAARLPHRSRRRAVWLRFQPGSAGQSDARTCVLHPASHTHRQLSDEQLREAGIAPDLVRLSVGIENIDDIIADLEQAIAKM